VPRCGATRTRGLKPFFFPGRYLVNRWLEGDAAWDTAFHVIAFAMIDTDVAKEQLLLLTREWYMHPNGQIPA
jgi:hypothetical protein